MYTRDFSTIIEEKVRESNIKILEVLQNITCSKELFIDRHVDISEALNDALKALERTYRDLSNFLADLNYNDRNPRAVQSTIEYYKHEGIKDYAETVKEFTE